ncbi:mitochondrial zinc-dependent alcohol dehydrogenase [Andalucia godoyi]|uniref:Mitochondrial zinc-dependent alcohol dehydrogenase n=1 Tax=Andalucia godoyi TaxID=505711 RepID=A0A8K0F295_ANDGO|nr:mitochondrial zinc-dependent alcohol dehydrogenase [Andalucia godoyi]|eukprot:ANDGO_05662.mRNA.1 mitochondrial zinc-dependent alcohol dehydrogenase
MCVILKGRNRKRIHHASTSKLGEAILGEKPVSTVTSQPRTDPSGAKMHALSWQGVEQIGYTEHPKPAITEAQDIVLRVTATTVCGSDLHLCAGDMPAMHKEDIIGHEFMGILESVGPKVATLKVRDRVVCSFDIACGTCDYCKREEYTGCDMTNPSKLMEYMYGH